jgi:hypothetical protein
MAVFPYQETVTLEFKPGLIDWFSYLLSLTSFGLLGIIIKKQNKARDLLKTPEKS